MVVSVDTLTFAKNPFIPDIWSPNIISPCETGVLFIKLAQYLFSFLSKPALNIGWTTAADPVFGGTAES